MQGGVTGGHLRAGVTKEPLDHVLRDTFVDHPRAECVAELIGGDGDGLASFVMESNGFLPTHEPLPQGRIVEGAVTIGVGMRSGKQHRRPARPAVAEVVLLSSDRVGSDSAERDQTLGRHLGVVVAQARPPGTVVDDRVERQRAGVAGSQPGLDDDGHERPCGVVRQPVKVGWVLELRHDELGDETRQRPWPRGEVVVVEHRSRRQPRKPAVTATGVEEPA